LTPRERVRTALAHKEPDRVPMDLGGAVSCIHMKAYERLIERLGIKAKPKLSDKIQQLAKPDEEVLQALEVDFRHIGLKKGFFAGAEDRYDDPSGRPYFIDEWGIKWGKNPFYYDMVDHPLKDATVEDLEKYDWPDPRDPERYEGLREEVKNLYYSTDYALVADAIFGGVFECAWWLRGFEKFVLDMHKRPEFAEALLSKILELYIGFYDRYLSEVGDYVEMVEVGDDVGAQTAPLISPALLRKYIKPRWKELYNFIHGKTKARIFHHSCGSVYIFLNDFIEAGVDVLNPIQPRAAMMDIGRIKREAGDKLVLHGGIDNQRVLPYGTPVDVENEVKRVLRAAAPGGGYVLAVAHNIQADTPPENILAMFKSALKYGSYPIRL
jgi:uroporphyrinogen decarboxylase